MRISIMEEMPNITYQEKSLNPQYSFFNWLCLLPPLALLPHIEDKLPWTKCHLPFFQHSHSKHVPLVDIMNNETRCPNSQVFYYSLFHTIQFQLWPAMIYTCLTQLVLFWPTCLHPSNNHPLLKKNYQDCFWFPQKHLRKETPIVEPKHGDKWKTSFCGLKCWYQCLIIKLHLPHN